MGKNEGVLVPLTPGLDPLGPPAVQSVYLQSPTTWNSVFTSATTISAKTNPDLVMHLMPDGSLELTHPVGGTCRIPSANVKIALLK